MSPSSCSEREIGRTPAYYIPLADVSRATATNDLAAAVAAGLLEPKGGGRSRRYVAAPSICRLIAAALGIDLVEHDTRESIVAFLSRALAEPGTAVDFDGTAEGDATRYGPDGRLVGLTTLNARSRLEKDGRIELTLPEQHLMVSDLGEALS